MEYGPMMVVLLSLAFAEAPSDKSKHTDLAKPIGRLLDFSAEPSPKAFKAIEHAYRSLPAATRKQPTVQYAYVVALIRQKRYQEASRVLHELVDEQPGDLAVWRAKIWIELELGQRAGAITDLEQLGSHATAHQEAAHERLADKDAAEFFGAVCGFLVGPWSHKVREEDAKAVEERLRAVFDDNGQAAFDEAKARFAERYEEVFKEHEDRVQTELAAKTKELDDAKQSVGRKAQELSQKQQAIKDKHLKRDAERKTKIGDIDVQLKKIDQQRQSLLVQIAPLEAQRAALLAQMAPQMANMAFPFLSRHMQRAVIDYNAWPGAFQPGPFYKNRMQAQLTAVVAKITSLEMQISSLNQQELELRGQGFQTEIKHQTDLGKLANQEQEIDKNIKRVKYDAQRLQVKTAVTTPRLRAEADRLTRFVTYAPFPVESEKARLLAEVN